jgi:capsid protein
LAAQGLDSETIDAENASDNQRADELGLIYDSDARNPLQGPRVTEAAGPSDPVESEPATPPTPIDKKKGAA